ncbi:exosome-associated family protein [Cordyceps fumosorosea ARSEF 2679]|uniref:Exosome complex protein n=1 Tax=Cordyceps fumosorosea (strain ARSEF 2679) TaxID=1081104 RepID=A0A167SYJ5_CORFA|nr:exosome-associated family protein [Cordyceps fumosorosea ARSEF 2679]OAA60064.1 exosome-associated family protein [Cordyceps fumosorosea ARSEF 2679]
MADVKDITRDLDKLDSQLDNLEEALAPLLGNLDELSSQLPLLDKAKLFSLAAYSIESLLFSTLKLQGADAQNHPVYAELKRVQQYFGKIKAVEQPAGERNTTVNQEAAARVLKADLSDNKAIRDRLAEKIAEERAKALLRSVEGRKRPAEDSAASSTDDSKGVKKSRNKHKSKGKSKK